MTTTDNSPADILDFRLLDEAGHPALNIEEEGRSNVLRLEIENLSANMLAFPPTTQQRAMKGEHHFSVSFRPGALSDQTIARLTDTDPPKDVLDRATGWDLRVERARRPIDPVTLYFLYTASGDTPRMAAAGGVLKLELHNIAASPGDGVRPSAAQLGIDKMYVGSRLDNFFRLQRRTELYITHAGGRPSGGRPAGPPLRLDLLDDVAIAVGGTSHTAHFILSNTSTDTTIGGDHEGDHHITLVMEIGEKDLWWALAAKGEFDSADYANLTATPVGGRDRLEEPMERSGDQGFPNALHWKVRLPNGRLLPGQGIDLTIGLKTTRAMPLAIHIVSDLAHFGANRQTFLFPRSRFTLRQFGHDISDLKSRTSSTEASTQRHGQALTTHGAELRTLKGEIASLKEDFDLQLAGLTAAANRLLNTFAKDTHFTCDPNASSLKTKNTKLESLKLQFSVFRGGDGNWGIGPRFSGKIILEQSPKPKDGAFLAFPAAKSASTGFHGLWFHDRNGLLFEYFPHSGRLYYHGQAHGINVSEIAGHTPRMGHMGGWWDMVSAYNKAQQELLKKLAGQRNIAKSTFQIWSVRSDASPGAQADAATPGATGRATRPGQSNPGTDLEAQWPQLDKALFLQKGHVLRLENGRTTGRGGGQGRGLRADPTARHHAQARRLGHPHAEGPLTGLLAGAGAPGARASARPRRWRFSATTTTSRRATNGCRCCRWTRRARSPPRRHRLHSCGGNPIDGKHGEVIAIQATPDTTPRKTR